MSSDEYQDRGISRRGFLGTAFRAAVGAGVACLELPLAYALVVGTEKITHHPAGNASMQDESEKQCLKKKTREKCSQDVILTSKEKFEMVVTGPFIEEGMFRAFPSSLIDASNESDIEVDDRNPTIYGTGGFSFTRKELVVGGVSSVLFGAAHNITRSGFDTNNIPISQTMGGCILWALQRKMGFAANYAEHSTFNFLVLKLST